MLQSWILSQGTAAVGSFIGESISPGLIRAKQWSLRDDPVMIPDVTTLLASYLRGHLDDREALQWGLTSQGATLMDKRGGSDTWSTSPRAKLWESAAHLLFERPKPDILVSSLVRGIISSDQYAKQGRKAGIHPDAFREVWDAYRHTLTPTELIVLLNREHLTEEQFDKGLVRYGGYLPKDLEAYRELAKAIPGYSDLVRFAVKDAFSAEKVSRWKFADEFPEEFQKWMKRQGMGWDLGFNVESDGKQVPASWAMLYWIAHWQNPSPTQLYEWFHRFRGNPDDRATWRDPNVKPFTAEDVDDWLRINDYPPEIRTYLRNASYRLPGRIDLRRAYRNGVIQQADLKEGLQDLGFNEQSADILAKTEEVLKDIAENKAHYQRQTRLAEENARLALKAYERGASDEARATAILQILEWTPEEIDAALANARARSAYLEVAEGLRHVKRAFIIGAIDDATAKSLLIVLGLVPARADRYLSVWRLQKTLPRAVASASKWLDWYKRHLVTADDASLALKNLGLVDREIVLHVASAEQDIERDRLKAAAARARTEAERGRALERLARKAEMERRRIRSELQRHGTPAQLKRWLKLGLIDVEPFRKRLVALDWPAEDIDRLQAEALMEGDGDDGEAEE